MTDAPDPQPTREALEMSIRFNGFVAGVSFEAIPFTMRERKKVVKDALEIDRFAAQHSTAARQAERERIQEQGWCYQHRVYHRNFRCEHNHGAIAAAPAKDL